MKYARFLTEDEACQLDAIQQQKTHLQSELRALRKPYLELFWKARDRAKVKDQPA